MLRRSPTPRPLLLGIILLLAASAGCATRGGRGNGGTGTGGDDNHGNLPDTDGGSTVTPPTEDGSTIPVRPEDVIVYAHSKDTLFAFSPSDLTVTPIGPFTLPGGEIAVDAAGEIYTVGRTALFKVNADTATATLVAPLAFDGDDVEITGLAFIPAGAFQDKETLLGADNRGRVYEINRQDA
ncbi:MAG: hypothetical protein KC416_06995, partial [Myxococcales bacterium]|nr:hypothetical protein [Myxococcales bacterium]